MNLTNTIQPKSEEGFTIRELSILLPPQLLKTDGLPPDYLVPLPIEGMQSSFEQGRPCLRLSQIVNACPYLFLRPLQPGEDLEVVLPYQKVRRILDEKASVGPQSTLRVPASLQPAVASPFAMNERRQDSRLTDVDSSEKTVLSPKDTPFRSAHLPAASNKTSAHPTASIGSPFRMESPQPPPSSQDASPTPALPGTPDTSSPFSLADRLPGNARPPKVPAPHSSSPFQLAHQAVVQKPGTEPQNKDIPSHIPPPRDKPAFNTVSLPLPNTSKRENAQPAVSIPESPHSEPMTRPAPPVAQLPPLEEVPVPEPPSVPPVAGDGSASITLRLNVALRQVAPTDLGFDPSQIPDSVSVEIPLALIKPQLATGKVFVGIPEIVQGVVEKFRPAFARARVETQVNLPLAEVLQAIPKEAMPKATPVPTSAMPPSAPPQIFATPFQRAAQEDAIRVTKPNSVLPPLSVVSVTPTAETQLAEQSFLAAHEDLGSPRNAESLSEAPPENLPLRGTLPTNLPPIKHEPPVVASPATSLPAKVTTASVVQEQATTQDLQFGYSQPPQLLALRYLLETSDPLTPENIIQRIATQPGVRAAVLITPAGEFSSSAENQEPEGFFRNCSQSHLSLKALVESIGLPPQGSFTLRADKMVRTFFLEGNLCVAVLQKEAQLPQLTKDKLILTTRELAALYT